MRRGSYTRVRETGPENRARTDIRSPNESGRAPLGRAVQLDRAWVFHLWPAAELDDSVRVRRRADGLSVLHAECPRARHRRRDLRRRALLSPALVDTRGSARK